MNHSTTSSSSPGEPGSGRQPGAAAWRTALLPLAVGFWTLLLHGLHILLADGGRGLISPYPTSDAALYLHKAWMAAFVHPGGGTLGPYIPVSPYLDLLQGALLVGGPGYLPPILLNAGLAALAAAGTALAGRRLLGERAGWAAGLLVAHCGPLFFFAGMTVKSTFVLAALAWGLWGGVAAIISAAPWGAAMAATGLGFACLDRNNLIVVPALWLIAWGARLALGPRPARRRLALAALALAAGAALPASYLGIRAADREQAAVSPMGFNYFTGNNPMANGTYTVMPFMRDDIIGALGAQASFAERTLGRKLSAAEVDRFWLTESFAYARAQPLNYLKLQARKLGMAFSAEAPGHPEQWGLYRPVRAIYALAPVDLGLLMALAAWGGFLLVQRRWPPTATFQPRPGPVLWLLGAALAYLLTVAAFFVVERFRMPVAVLLAPIAGWGVLALVRPAWAVIHPHPGRLRAVGLAVVAGLYGGAWGLTALHPDGPGWFAKREQVRENETALRRQVLRTYRLRAEGIREGDAAKLTAVGELALQMHYVEDAIALAERALRYQPLYPPAIHLLRQGVRETGDYRRLSKLPEAPRMPAPLPATPYRGPLRPPAND